MKVRENKLTSTRTVSALLLVLLIVFGTAAGNANAQTLPELWSSDPIDGAQDVDPVEVYLNGIKLQFNMVWLKKATIAVMYDGQSFECRTEMIDKSQAIGISDKPLPYDTEIVVMWRAEVFFGGKGNGMITFTTKPDPGPPFVVSVEPAPDVVTPEQLKEDGITFVFNEPIGGKPVFDVSADGNELKHRKARVSKDRYFAWLTAGQLTHDTRIFLEWKDRFDRIRRTTGEVSWDTEIDFELSFQDLDGNSGVFIRTVDEGGGGVRFEDLIEIDDFDIKIVGATERPITYCFATLTIPATGQSDPDCIDIDYLDLNTVSLTVGESELLQPKTKCVIEVELTDIFSNDGYFEIEFEAPDDEPDNVPPSIVWSDPINGAQGVEVYGCPEIIGVITVQFSEPIDESHIVLNVFDSKYVEWTEEWSDEKNTLTITYKAGVELPDEKEVMLEIKVKDDAGNKADCDISFTTAPKE